MQAQFHKTYCFLQGKRIPCFQRYRTNACTNCGILRPKKQTRKTRCPCIWIQRLQKTNAYPVERDLRRFMTEWRYFSEMTRLINLSFHHETGEILELPTCGLCSISVPGDIQNFTECWPKQADKRWPFFEEGVGWTRRPLKVLYNFINFFFFKFSFYFNCEFIFHECTFRIFSQFHIFRVLKSS